MPPGAAELAVGDGLEADSLLHADDIDDGSVLGGTQLIGGDRVILQASLARRLDGGGTQEAADDIGAEGRLAGCWGRHRDHLRRRGRLCMVAEGAEAPSVKDQADSAATAARAAS
jgi:hypothetical protein